MPTQQREMAHMNDRRSWSQDALSFGPFDLFGPERLLKKAGKPVPLGGRALDMLIVLTERAGEVVTQGELMERVWPNVNVDENNLRVHISALRKALGDGQDGARYISSVAGRGYCFVAPVKHPLTEQRAPPSALVDAERFKKLPPPLSRMVGREDIVQTVSAELMLQRFVSIVGPGGIGKTTVAVSVAHKLLTGFEGAVFFVDFSVLTTPKLVPTAVASTLGFMAQAHDPIGSLLAFLSEKKVLLILDNCEHVIDTAAALAERVVSEAPQAYVLATSRETLRVRGEHVHLLGALEGPPEDGKLTATQALSYPAAELFMERAIASGYASNLTDLDARIVARICRKLDGIALAIELVASHVGAFGIRGIAELLDSRFGLLWQGRRTALPRHETLNAMLDWSYNLLSAREKVVLCKLSVFVGDFTLEAACFLASETETEDASVTDTLDSLLAKSLLSHIASHGSTYYRLLDTTRAYVGGKLAKREASRVARRHASFFSKFFQQDEIVRTRFGEQDLSGYTPHIGNVRAALEWAFSADGDVAAGVELTTWTASLFMGLSLLEECDRWCERALACLDDADQGTRKEMILQEALALSSMYISGNADRSRAAIERGLALERAFGDRCHQLQLLYGLYRLLMRLGDFRTALAAAQESATLGEDAQDPASLVVADFMLGTCYHFMGDQAAAQFYSERGMARASEPGAISPNFFGFDRRVYAPVSLARTLWLRGFADRACGMLRTAIVEAESRGPLTVCVALSSGVPVFLWSGDFRTAGDHVDQLIEYAGRHSLEPYRASGIGLKGILAIARDDVEAGVDLLRTAQAILSAKKLTYYLTLFAGMLADGLRMTGQLEEALLTVNGAIARATDCGSTYDMPELLRIKAQIFAAMPRYGPASAMNCVTEAIEVARVQSALALELRSTMTLARVLSEGGQRDQARLQLGLVYDRFTEGFQTADLKMARGLLEKLQP
jgi:predicted ATPase/DNA-binding winged helix-turn-helix (wHTH) protein